MKQERSVFVYTTYPSLDEAERIGKAILEKRLAACVNILPGMVSHYWWKGAIERAEEVVAIFKTRASLAEELRQALSAVHPYETPSFMVVAAESVDAKYYQLILDETKEPEGERA